ncbi:MAG TPA: acetolactate decarboxylase, partial [Microbacteriaceae bacterium]|nr:acetolactate decarboxylase [Microbacteriaceae bacterium]
MTIARLAPGEAVTQFAVLDALLVGAYESGIAVSDVCALGDFGLGCCDRLGGEVVILDGEAFECTPDGLISRMTSGEILPFAVCCRFPAGDAQSIANADLTAL